MAEKRWIPETLFDDLGFRMTFEVDKVLYELHTEHQHLILFEQQYFGKMLMLGLHLIEHLVDLEGHAEAEVIEQRLGNPALLGQTPF